MSSQVDDINKAYVSPYDEFLFAFDEKNKPSKSQQQEIKKHKRIAYLRDNVDPVDAGNAIWENF